MFHNDNPWSDWLGAGVFAHPNAPCRGGGSRRHPGIRDYRGGAVDPFSPVGRYLNPREAAQGYAEYELERVLQKLFFCRQPSELPGIAREAFGHGSFSERFSQALVLSPPASRFFALQRMMVQAELHDHLQGAGGWQLPFRFSTVVSPKLWEVGHYLRFGSGMRRHEELQKAATTRDALLKELAALFAQPVKVFEEARAKLPAATRENWTRYNDLARPVGNRTDAGHALGFVVAKTLPMLADLQRRGDFQVKISGAAPQLARYAQILNEIASSPASLMADDSSSPAPAIDTRAKIPFHNDDALEPKVEEFKTDRPVDMNNLSAEENDAVETMKANGRDDPKKQKQLLSSADSFETSSAKKGNSLYGFTSSGYPKGKDSMYWLTEEDYADVKAKYCQNGVWDREGVKNHLALPCFNRANSIVKCEVIEDHTAIRSHIGPATERVSYSNDSFSSGMYTKPMPGGGYQYTPNASKISTETIIS